MVWLLGYTYRVSVVAGSLVRRWPLGGEALKVFRSSLQAVDALNRTVRDAVPPSRWRGCRRKIMDVYQQL